MFSGICGGKVLLGSQFPLRNIPIPYINNDREVQKDIYSVYTTDDPEVIGRVLKKYNCTHVFFSRKVLRHIEHLTRTDKALEPITGLQYKDYSKTLFNKDYFTVKYKHRTATILRWKK